MRGADKSGGSVCEHDPGWERHIHPLAVQFHGSASPNGEKYAASQAKFAMAQEADAESLEVLLKTIRIAWGGAVGIQAKLACLTEVEWSQPTWSWCCFPR